MASESEKEQNLYGAGKNVACLIGPGKNLDKKYWLPETLSRERNHNSNLSTVDSDDEKAGVKPATNKRTTLSWPICRIGDEMACFFAITQTWKLVEIITLRRDEVTEQFLYYVRFKDYDKRLDEWVPKHRLRKPTAATILEEQNKSGRRSTRGQKRSHEEMEKLTPQEKEYEQQHEELNKMRNIERVIIGNWCLKTWYFSPYPEKYNRPGGTLFVCEYCLKYMQRGSSLRHHLQECVLRHPPGDEIYRHNGVSIFEVDDHKTLYFGVSPFLFYVVCEYDSEGYHAVGFFSKEKNSPENFNLACILVFPYQQRKGWGRFLIAASYELTRLEGKTGSPEKPLSDLGKKAYRSYWSNEVLQVCYDTGCQVSIKEIANRTGIDPKDVVDTILLLNLNTYYKKQHSVAQDKLALVTRLLQDCEERQRLKTNAKIFDGSKMDWKPRERTRRKRNSKKLRTHPQ